MSDEDREVALKVLELAIEMKVDEQKSQAAWIAKFTWSNGEETK